MARDRSSEISLALFLLHRASLVVVDDAALPFRAGRTTHFRDDRVQRLGARLDRAGQRIATQRAETNLHHPRLLAGRERQAIIIDHDQRAVALHDRTLLGEIQGHNRNVLGPDVFPHVEFGPIGQWKHPHGFARLDTGIEQLPQLGPLIARVPAMARGAVRENALLGAALFLIAPRPTESGVEAPLVQGLAQAFRFHHLGVDRRARGYRRNTPSKSFLVDVYEHVHAQTAGGFVAKCDHLAEFPGRIDVKQREWRLARMKRLLRDAQQRARILAHRIEHHGIAVFADDLAHNIDCLGLEPTQTNILVTPGHLPNSRTTTLFIWD